MALLSLASTMNLKKIVNFSHSFEKNVYNVLLSIGLGSRSHY